MSSPAATTIRLAEQLFEAFQTGRAIPPPRETEPGLDVAGAYEVQRALVELHRSAGREPVGRKIGLTSEAIQRQLGVDSPDYGVLFDTLSWESGATVSRSAHHMILPRIEAELAFVVDRELRGPGVSAEDVLAATTALVPVYELIDSRVENWRITLVDTVADNASSFGVVRGAAVPWRNGIDLAAIELELEHDGTVMARGTGAAVLGHPAGAIAWLANALAEYGEGLPTGQLLLSGSFTAAFELAPGLWRARFGEGVGEVAVRIAE
jgi:2-keto-4-pentenoate hydratase